MRSKFWNRHLAISALAVLAISLVVTAAPGASAIEGSGPIPEKRELMYPNLGSRLNDLAVRVEEGTTSVQEAADSTAVQKEGSVAVTIYLSGNVANVTEFLEDNGGSPRNVGEGYIEAYVPVTLLGELSEQPGVLRVREIVPPQETQDAPIAGQGPAVHGSRPWNWGDTAAKASRWG